MDTSPEYIKMCEKAGEIQKLKGKVSLGSWYERQGVKYLWEGNSIFVMYDTKIVWLPRQDQLQEMMGINYLSALSFKFHQFIDGFYPDKRNIDGFANVLPPGYNFPCGVFTSMEQLWLAFVMKEKYGKMWRVKNWTDAGILIPA